MRIILLLLVVVVISILWLSDLSFGACPEDTNDNGICDTLYTEVFPPDTIVSLLWDLVRLPIFVTHDIPDPDKDSIAGFVIPQCYTHTNPAKYCSVSRYWNTASLSGSSLQRSLFRHLVLPSGDTLYNWFLRQKEMGDVVGEDWAWVHANLYQIDTSSFTFSAIPTTQPLFGEGSRVLLATVTFRVEDTMTICLDTCFIPLSYRLCFSRSDAVCYIPRDNMPYCFSISYPAIGDVTGDGVIDLGDVVYLTSYLYRGGPQSNPLWLGDTNCDGVVELGDRVKLGNYVYRGGSPPCSP